MAHPRSSSEAEGEEYHLDILPSPRTSTDHLTSVPEAEKLPKKPGHGAWLWEITAGTVSVAGFALLVGFLVNINNTSYVAWQYTVAPNKIVSIIITVAKSALLVPVSACLSQLKWNQYRRGSVPLYNMQAVDQASRGPWGSLAVLCGAVTGSRMDVWTLAGASITILALAIDPFAQQILAFPSRSVTARNGTAFIQAAHAYVTDRKNSNNAIDWHDPTLVSAIVSGIAQTNSPLEPQCTSVDCQFGEFVSLGICGTCDDVTAQANQSCYVSADWPFLDTPFNSTPLSCNYSVPDGLGLSITWEDAVTSTWYHNESAKFGMRYWSSVPHNIASSALGVKEPIVALLSANITQEYIYYVVANATTPPPKPVLTECIINYCEKQYSPSVYLGQDGYSAVISKTQPLVQENFEMYSGSSVSFGPPNGTTTLATDAAYTVDYGTYVDLNETLQAIFNGSVHAAVADIYSSQLSNLVLLIYWNGLRPSVESVATSLTNAIRSGPNATKIEGNAFEVETYIHVRWPWIILPVCVILATLVLLVGTTLASRHRQSTVLWKGSVIPLLASRVETTRGGDISSLQSLDDMHKLAKKIKTKLDRDQGAVFIEQ